jgi:hypothetical protein
VSLLASLAQPLRLKIKMLESAKKLPEKYGRGHYSCRQN